MATKWVLRSSDTATEFIVATRPNGPPERELVSSSVFDVIDMLKRNMVTRAAVDIIDGDQSVVALRECDVVIRLR